MPPLRSLLDRQRWFAAMLVAAALAVRLVVPAGFMPAGTGGLTLQICSGHMGATMPMAAMPGMSADRTHHDGHDPSGHDGADQPCGFAGLAMPSLGGGDAPAVPMPVAAPNALPVVDGTTARAPPAHTFLRPPLRGPPSIG